MYWRRAIHMMTMGTKMSIIIFGILLYGVKYNVMSNGRKTSDIKGQDYLNSVF